MTTLAFANGTKLDESLTNFLKITSPHIFTVSYWFKVIGINTTRYSTFMIQFQTVWYLSSREFVIYPMCVSSRP